MAEQLIGLFPIPFLKIDAFAQGEVLDALAARAAALADETNSATDQLSHSAPADPASDPLFATVAKALSPYLERFGEVLFAEKMPWHIKELWLNVLEPGGSQFMHTHANSFISGVLYVNQPHAASGTLFHKPSGGTEYQFRNNVPMGHYSADSWQVPEVQAGDLVLYPSYLMHGVPPNAGGRRISLAFNALPEQLDSHGYRVRFSP